MMEKRGIRAHNSRPHSLLVLRRGSCKRSHERDLCWRYFLPRKRSQVTIFIIIAIVLIAGVVGYFLFKDKLVSSGIPVSMQPLYSTFIQCLEDETKIGINVLEGQGGYIELPDFEAGSAYSPFGSQLYFLGNPIPYWYYVSGNNIEREQVPSVKNMEDELENFIEEKIKGCVFDSYYEEGFEIQQGEPNADVVIKKNSVNVVLGMNLNIAKGDENVLIKSHNVDVKSNLRELYESAREIYEYEQNNLFLEEYAIDVLRLYAPVDGVELTCSPLTWNADNIFSDLRNAIEANTAALKVKGGDYSLNDKKNKYFVIDLDVGKDVRFLSSANWAMSFEVAPADSSVMIANPVGNQQALGILGFCYVPYHFVYDVKYPVLVQIYDGEEIFQFPLSIIIEGNNPRKALDANAIEAGHSPGICEHRNTNVQVITYDSRGNSIDAEIFFECFGEKCDMGLTEGGILSTEFPQCVNGNIIAKAEGYKDARQIYTTAGEGTAEIFLNKLYDVDVRLKIDGRASNSNAIISFVSDDFSKTIVYPETKNIELSEGQYEISVYIYEESSLKLEGSSMNQCVEVPREGLGAFFGLTDEKCFEVEIPESIVSNALAGGGKQSHYILEEELASASVIEINADSLPTPKSIEGLQQNYILFENKNLDIYLK